MSFSYEVENAQDTAVARLVIAHGAGAGKSSDFMQLIAKGITQFNVEVVLFNFPYMQLIEQTGKRRPPDRMPKLESHFKDLLAHIEQKYTSLPTFIGGKSMGGRVATLISDTYDVKGGVVYGYPFHPPGKPEKTRTAHLADLKTPFLILQGERDPFGTSEEINHYSLSKAIQIKLITDGEHSFKPRKTSGLTQRDNIQTAIEKTAQFIKERCSQ